MDQDRTDSFEIRQLQEHEVPGALDFCLRIFREYESPIYSPEGTKEFIHSINDENYLRGIEYYGTFDQDLLIGVIGIRGNLQHICFFFVDGKYHRRGIGTQMFHYILKVYPQGKITLNSAPYGLPFYKRLGFTPTDNEQVVNGIRFSPMEYRRNTKESGCLNEDIRISVSEIMEKMIAYSDGNLHDIQHFSMVWTYARTIGKLETLDDKTQFILEVAAITHDIACPLCREKYGNTDGKHQEEEGGPLVREFLSDTGMSEDEIERVAYLVSHHHTLEQIGGSDYQILIEADYLENASENGYSRENLINFRDRYFRTSSGRKILNSVFQLDKDVDVIDISRLEKNSAVTREIEQTGETIYEE